MKEACRGMARPCRADLQRLERVARYLLTAAAVEWLYPWQELKPDETSTASLCRLELGWLLEVKEVEQLRRHVVGRPSVKVVEFNPRQRCIFVGRG